MFPSRFKLRANIAGETYVRSTAEYAECDESAASDTSDLYSEPTRFDPSTGHVQSPAHIVMVMAAINFLVIASTSMLAIPLARLLEDSFCHVYYNDLSLAIIEEAKCKTDEIQSHLRFFYGWSSLFHSLLGLIVAFPYSAMADKVGCKPALFFSYLGVVLGFGFQPILLHVFPQAIRRHPYILLSGSGFLLLGGGIPILLATTYSIAADVSTAEKKAANFLYLSFGATSGGIIGPIIASLLMQRFGPWVSAYSVLAPTPIVLLLVFLPPETSIAGTTLKSSSQGNDSPFSLQGQAKNGLRDLAVTVSLLKNRNVLLVLGIFLVQNARLVAATSLITQHISKYFDRTIAEASLLVSPFGLLNLVLLAALPRISQLLTSLQFRMSAFCKDLLLNKTTTCLFICGSAMQGLNHSLIPFLLGTFMATFGAADNPLARATVSHHVAPEYSSRLHTLIGITEVMGSFIGGPVLAYFFDMGMKLKGVWIGLPWFYVSFIALLARVALSFVEPPHITLDEQPTSISIEDVDEFLPDNPIRLR